MPEPRVLVVEAKTHGRCLVEAPESAPPHRLLVGFHGYAENAEKHLEQLRLIPGASEWLRVSVQGLNRFYRPKFEEVVAGWMTREDRELAIVDNIEYVRRVLAHVTSAYETSKLVFVGFSQGVAMAFRAAVHCGFATDGVITLGGDLPPDLREDPSSSFPRMLMATGERDPWYTPDRLRADVAHLESIGADVRSVVLDGAHEWTDAFRTAASEFLASF